MNGFLLPLDDAPGRPEPDGCCVSAFGVLQVPREAFPALRKQPGPDMAKPLAPGLLRQADEQAVAALVAVYTAVHDFGLQDGPFTDWAVVAAPRYLGRTTSATVLDKYRRQGPRGVSPLVSPYLSLHAVSSMISVGLGAHGPNLGVGGGPGAVADGLLGGLTVLMEQDPPGVWLVLTAWDPEPGVPDANDPPAVCHAAALALTAADDDATGLRLRYLPPTTADVRPRPAAVGASPPTVAGLVRFLAGRSGRRWCCPLPWGGEVELTSTAGRPVGSPASSPHLVEAPS